jgi:hypothetical protein
LENHSAATYLQRFAIDDFIVDREVVATMQDARGRALYIVPEPIQGRLATALR